MSNPLFNQLGGNNNMMQMLQQLKTQFKDPKQAVMAMLTNGQITQQQLDQAIKTAQQFKIK